MDEDLTLIQRYLEGDDYAVEELVMKYRKKIYFLAYRMTGDIEASKDLTQKTFMQAFSGIKSFRKESGFYTWLYQIALNICLNHLNKKGLHSDTLDENHPDNCNSALSSVLDKEKQKNVQESLKRLPERQRAAVILRAYEGLTSKKASEVMKCSEGAVKAHYHNGIKKLRELLKEKGYEIDS